MASRNLGQALTKKNFPEVFKTWERVANVENAVHGFRRSGLFPLNPNNIDMTKLEPSKVHSGRTASQTANSNVIPTAQVPVQPEAHPRVSIPVACTTVVGLGDDDQASVKVPASVTSTAQASVTTSHVPASVTSTAQASVTSTMCQRALLALRK